MSARMIHPEQWESKFYDDKGKIYVCEVPLSN